MSYKAINFDDKFSLVTEQWQPKVIAEMNDYQFKIVKLQRDFIWHNHKDTDETFIVVDGVLRIDFRDGAVDVSAGEMFVVPKGVEHKPYAEREVKLLLIEPRGVLNTGHEDGERTAASDVWILTSRHNYCANRDASRPEGLLCLGWRAVADRQSGRFPFGKSVLQAPCAVAALTEQSDCLERNDAPRAAQ
jgi:mannose-6-phosphate isomerase-like protein (cupin superfamily)